MERKIVKQGNSALTITLPHKWCKKFNLSEKDFVSIIEDGNDLILKNSNIINESVIELDLRNSNKKMLIRQIMGAYIKGYDIIKVKHDDLENISQLSTQFIGCIAEEVTSETLILKNIIKNPEDNFEIIFRRLTYQLIDLTRSIKISLIEELKAKEMVLNQNTNYTLRYINKYERINDKFKFFLLCTTLESVGDIIFDIAKINQVSEVKDKDVKELIHLIEYYVLHLIQDEQEKMHAHLQECKKKIKKETYIDGLKMNIIENLNNYIGFI